MANEGAANAAVRVGPVETYLINPWPGIFFGLSSSDCNFAITMNRGGLHAVRHSDIIL